MKMEENKIEDNKIENNPVLFISEIQNKVILPYQLSEVKEIVGSNENNYPDIQTIIEERYTVPLMRYQYACISRFRETFVLMREKEKASLWDSIDLALELMGKRYVHPAIITACKDAEQLDIYLDCLETNELEDFPFFKVQYELFVKKEKLS